jgi:glutathione S-transferase
MVATLYGLIVSPWTERACWALDHHGIDYEYREHVPLLGELALRRKARSNNPSTPLLVDGDDVVMGSAAIGKHADRVGRGERLFPSEHAADVDRWVDIAEQLGNVGRAWHVAQLGQRRDAQAEALPSFLPAALRKVLAPTTALGTSFLVKKYGVPSDVSAMIERTARPLLREVRTATARGSYLLPSDAFSFADVAVAAVIHMIRPHENAKIGPATRSSWTNDALVADFGDLLTWRDAIYKKHRRAQRGAA